MQKKEQNNDIPRHVGIIMDGNGRWAVKRGMPRKAGYKYGADVFTKIARYAAKLGVEFLTVYTFSTENWSRPPEEVAAIMDLLRTFLRDAEKYRKDNMRLIVLGDPAPLASDIQKEIERIHRESSGNTGMTVNIALNYGGRDELVHAARALMSRFRDGMITDIDAVTADDFAACLYTAGQPDVDLIIRAGGEMRLSNFLLWQSAYAEYTFPQVLWPDFTPRHFDEALDAYARRDRRFGGV
ncbi:MAG: di-trans,poly-cis-decaprenylcistransferase [Oscillospiraceae bacterium]|jgi:undecaprenyl diphosphate synthase|nr:di-trans,poly-cis-decaprenylcistransferase [Oscillospiraceae bacterium]